MATKKTTSKKPSKSNDKLVPLLVFALILSGILVGLFVLNSKSGNEQQVIHNETDQEKGNQPKLTSGESLNFLARDASSLKSDENTKTVVAEYSSSGPDLLLKYGRSTNAALRVAKGNVRLEGDTLSAIVYNSLTDVIGKERALATKIDIDKHLNPGTYKVIVQVVTLTPFTGGVKSQESLQTILIVK